MSERRGSGVSGFFMGLSGIAVLALVAIIIYGIAISNPEIVTRVADKLQGGQPGMEQSFGDEPTIEYEPYEGEIAFEGDSDDDTQVIQHGDGVTEYRHTDEDGQQWIEAVG